MDTELTLRPMLIGGAWVPAAGGGTIAVENPADRTPIAIVPRGGAADVEAAMAAAQAAFLAWSRVPPRERGRALLRIADRLEAEAEAIARQVAQETGNALRTQARPKRAALPRSSAISAAWAANCKARPSRSASTC